MRRIVRATPDFLGTEVAVWQPLPCQECVGRRLCDRPNRPHHIGLPVEGGRRSTLRRRPVVGHDEAVTELGLRNDVYRRPLATALDRLGLAPGWRCADVGAGGGDVTVALAELVGREGRIYAVDSDPGARDEVARAAAVAGQAQVLAVTQAGEDLLLPEPVDLAFCRFLL